MRGFTLLELMIVAVIVAILAMVAYPTYTAQVRETARKEAVGVVLEVAGRLERIRSQLLAYPTEEDQLADLEQTTQRYSVTVESTGPTYTITATPSGDQASDLCGTFSYTNAGVWTFASGRTEDDCI